VGSCSLVAVDCVPGAELLVMVMVSSPVELSVAVVVVKVFVATLVAPGVAVLRASEALVGVEA
jgi:hypothetical protein